MKNKTISKSIRIGAPREKVWEVLTNDQYNRLWFSEFSEGTRAESDWQQDSKITFTDGRGGIVGKIIVWKPFEALSFEYTGMLSGGKEDYESELAQSVKGALEIYKLSVENGQTVLDIACEMAPDCFLLMEEAWERALHKIRQLAEGLVTLKED